MRLRRKNIIEGIISGLLAALILFLITIGFNAVRSNYNQVSSPNKIEEVKTVKNQREKENHKKELYKGKSLKDGLKYIQLINPNIWVIIFAIVFIEIIFMFVFGVFLENYPIAQIIFKNVSEGRAGTLFLTAFNGSLVALAVIDMFMLDYIVLSTFYFAWNILLVPGMIAAFISGMLTFTDMEEGFGIVFIVIFAILVLISIGTGFWWKTII